MIMKVYLRFELNTALEDAAEKAAIDNANDKSWSDPVLYDWKYPELPRVGDFVDLYELKTGEEFLPIPDYFDEATDLGVFIFDVNHIRWRFSSGEIIPEILLHGDR